MDMFTYYSLLMLSHYHDYMPLSTKLWAHVKMHFSHFKFYIYDFFYVFYSYVYQQVYYFRVMLQLPCKICRIITKNQVKTATISEFFYELSLCVFIFCFKFMVELFRIVFEIRKYLKTMATQRPSLNCLVPKVT